MYRKIIVRVLFICILFLTASCSDNSLPLKTLPESLPQTVSATLFING